MKTTKTALFAAALLLASAAAAKADPYERLAKDLTKKLGEYAGKKTAVVPFSYTDARQTEGGAVVAAAMETALVGRGLVVVERAHLDKLLEEMNLQRTGIVPEKSALQIGKTAGAEFLITGTLADFGPDRVDVNARLIKVETGEVLRAAKARVQKTWADGPPIGSLKAAGVPPQGAAVRFSLQSPSVSGATRRVGDRDLALRYADQGNRPVLRITDFTDKKKPDWMEIPFNYEPRTHHYSPNWKEDFRLSGRGYRMSVDVWQQFHIVPISGVFSREVKEQEVTLPINSAFEAWIEDIGRRSAALAEYKGASAAESWRQIAYFEPMEGADLRISIYAVQISTDNAQLLSYSPIDVLVLKGDKSQTVSSRLAGKEANLYRFRYSAASQEVAAEKTQ